MARNINFVRERQRSLTKVEAQDALILRWTSIVIGVIVALVFIAVGTRLYFVYSLKAVTADQQKVRQAITSHEEVEKSFTVFAYKLKALTDLFGKRREKQEALSYFSNLFGPDVIIRELAYSDATQVLTFTLESKNIFVLENVFNTLGSDSIKQKYPTIQKDSLRRSNDGRYGVGITIALGTPDLATASAATTTPGVGTTQAAPTLAVPAAP